MPAFLLYRTFTEPAAATAIAALLDQAGIPFLLADETGPKDFTKPFDRLNAFYKLKLRSADFAAADALIAAYYETQLAGADPGYFLFSFTDAELIDVIRKPDEWGDYNDALARKLLADRGIAIPGAVAESIREARIDTLRRPERDHGPLWLITGYLLALAGGLVGIMIGSYLAGAKRTLPDGTQVPIFNARYRKHGRMIRATGIIMLAILAWLRFRNDLYS